MISPRAAVKNPNSNLCTCGVFLYRDGRRRGVVVIVHIVQAQKPARHISPKGARVERSYIEMVVVVVVHIVQSQKPARHISPRGGRVECSYTEMDVVVV